MLDRMASPPCGRRGRRVVAALALALVGALVLAACDDGGGGSEKDAARRRTTTSTAAGTTSSSGPTTTSSTVPPLTPAPPNSCGATEEFITDAVEGDEADGLAARKDEFSVQNCRLSQSERIWAIVDLVPEPGSSFAPTSALMERIGATWTVRRLGIAGVNCDAPERARVELGLECPG
jgi:hypothetical protein